MIKIQREHQGYGLMAGGILAALLAAWLCWTGFAHWRMVANLRDAALDDFTGQRLSARGAAQTAAGWSTSAAAVLAASDPTAPGTAEDWKRAAGELDGNERRAVLRGRGFALAIQGQDPGSDAGTGIDGQLIAQLAALKKQTTAPLPELPGGGSEAPTAAVLHRLLEERVATAWRVGDGRALAADAHRLLALDPRHPAQAPLRLIAHWCQATAPRGQIAGAANDLRDEAARAWWLRRLLALTTAQPALLGNAEEALRNRQLWAAELIPARLRSDAESALLGAQVVKTQTRTDSPAVLLQAAMAAAKKEKTDTAVAKALGLAIDQQKYAEAKELLPLVPETERAGVALAIAQAAWDLPALTAAGSDGKDFLPKVTHLLLADGRIAAHVATPAGLFPPKAIRVLVDDVPLAPNLVQRIGPALEARTAAGASRLHIKLDIDGQTLCDELLRQ